MNDKVFLVTTDSIGQGSRELGGKLAGNFIRLLAQGPNMPKAIFFLNRGVYLACAGSEALGHLKVLQERGVEILCCQTCVDYYSLQQEVQVGLVVGMAELLVLTQEHQVITIA